MTDAPGAVKNGPPTPAPPAAPADDAAPPRVCWGEMTGVNSPVASFSKLAPACGRPQRLNLDALTQDRDLVTCPECLRALARPGGSSPPVTHGGGPRPGQDVRDKPGSPPALRQVLDSLDSAALLARLAELEGEVAAVKVLLEAARAREGVHAQGLQPLGRKAGGKRKAEASTGDGGAA